ncbi:MAG: hypothetical protein IJ113_02665 [Eggerthellaceae bacterium]|nr:hypothetical protein [Eggerthellaceae bacterium]
MSVGDGSAEVNPPSSSMLIFGEDVLKWSEAGIALPTSCLKVRLRLSTSDVLIIALNRTRLPDEPPISKVKGGFFMTTNDQEKLREARKRADDKRKDWRARAWQCVVYPESAPADWKEKLHSQGIAYDISPLHDQDKCSDGSPKKVHHHVVLDWGVGKHASGDQAMEIFDIIGAIYPDPEKDRKLFLEKCKVKRLISAQRYLCHLDEHDPNKVQYPVDKIISGHQELPYSERVLRTMEKDEMAIAMIDFCVEEDIYDFATFVLKSRTDHPEWMHAIINERQGTFVNRFLNGRLAANREERERMKMLLTTRRFENETGELVDWETLRSARA